jgi:hypothetical protein
LGHHRWSAYHRTHEDSDDTDHRGRASPGDRPSDGAPGHYHTAYAGQRDHAAQYGDAAVHDAQDWDRRAPEHDDQVHDSDRASADYRQDSAFGCFGHDGAPVDTEQFPVDVTGAPVDTEQFPVAFARAAIDTVAAVHADDESTCARTVATVHADDENAFAAVNANHAGPSTSADSCTGARPDEIEREAEGLGSPA